MKNLLSLRYRLLWAHVRSRKGKTVLFLVAYLLASLIGLLLMLGGLGAAAAAIQLGKAELVARIVLSSFYLFGISASVVLGIGINEVFSDASLRRYPISPGERVTARYLTAFLEPLWLLLLAFNSGVALGFCAFGAAFLWPALITSILLTVSNFLLARVIAGAFGWLMASRYALLGLFATFGFSLGLPLLLQGESSRTTLLAVFRYTPPFAAAGAMTGTESLSLFMNVLLLLVCCAGLAVLLMAVDRLPAPASSAGGIQAKWDSLYDRIAARFDPSLAPLVGQMLRYYARSPQTRFNYFLTLPLLAFMLFRPAHSQSAPMELFLTAVGIIPLAGTMCTGALPVNIFGFNAPGFRRYLLLPTEPASILRAVSLTGLIPGATLIIIALVLWLLFAPISTSALMVIMLFSSAVTGWLLFHALGLWTSLLSPRPVEFDLRFGNKLSLGANIVMIGFFVVFFAVLPAGLRALGPDRVLSHWWLAPLSMIAVSAAYLLSLRAAGVVFAARRERILSLLEGRG